MHISIKALQNDLSAINKTLVTPRRDAFDGTKCLKMDNQPQSDVLCMFPKIQCMFIGNRHIEPETRLDSRPKTHREIGCLLRVWRS